MFYLIGPETYQSTTTFVSYTGNTTPTGTKENDVFSPLAIKKMIWKQILIDLLNRFYVIKKNGHWMAYQKYTNRLKKAQIWLILYDFSDKSVTIVPQFLTIASEIG